MSNNDQHANQQQPNLAEEGYQQALTLMRRCATEHGFLATPTEQDNYRRIWARDGAIIGVAALLSEDNELINGCRRTVETLARHQGPHGEIPSNVDPITNRVSYGGTAGRVDANLWFVIGCGQYWRHSGDDDWIGQMLQPLEKVRFLLGSWEFNNRGLLYVPPTGDWADDLDDRVARLKHLIQANFWFADGGEIPDDVYHEVLYEKGRQAAPHRRGANWMPFFSLLGYGCRFNAMANALGMLLDVADDTQCEAVDDYIVQGIVHDDVMLLPAFDPVITPKDEEWSDLQMTFSHSFKNSPCEYHNGGLWPLVTGFYVASLAKRGRLELARRFCQGIHSANRMEQKGRAWSFPEYLHGKEHTPGGTSPMGWSAASAVIAEQFVGGKRLWK